jgi:hypothetical protein
MIYSQEIRLQASAHYLAGRGIFPRIMGNSEKEIFPSCLNHIFPCLNGTTLLARLCGQASLRNQRRAEACPASSARKPLQQHRERLRGVGELRSRFSLKGGYHILILRDEFTKLAGVF